MKHYSRIGRAILITLSVGILASCSSTGSKAFNKESSTQRQRYAMSFQEIKTAALKGDADAQYALGFMYYYGKQVKRDTAQAKTWISKAATQGQPRAITALKLMGEPLPGQQQPKIAQRPQSKVAPTIKTAAMKPSASFSNEPHGPQPQPNPAPRVVKLAKNKSKPIKKIARKSIQAKKPIAMAVNKTQVLTTEQKLLKRHDDHFTLQLIGSHSIAQVKDVMKKNHLDSNASIYHTAFKGKDWYVLIYGDYATPDDALAAIDRLPNSAQQLKPWVKPYASVKVGIRTKPTRHI